MSSFVISLLSPFFFKNTEDRVFDWPVLPGLDPYRGCKFGLYDSLRVSVLVLVLFSTFW